MIELEQESWTPYHYSFNNPVLLSDPDGQWPTLGEIASATGDFLNGIANAASSNATTFESPIGQVSAIDRQSGGQAFTAGQAAGDVFSAVQGAVEFVGGAAIAAGGTGGGVVTSVTGVGAIAGAAVAAGGIAVAAHGGSTALNAINNLMGNGRVQVQGNSKSSSNAQHGYEIKNKQTGDIHKYGVSGGKLNNNGTSGRANTQVNKLNKAAGSDIYKARVVKKDVQGRQKILDWEKGKVKGYKEANPIKAQPQGNILPKVD